MVQDGDRRLTCGLHTHYWILAQRAPALSSLQGPAGLLTDAALASHLAENRPAFHTARSIRPGTTVSPSSTRLLWALASAAPAALAGPC
jgi:hypothetical protein